MKTFKDKQGTEWTIEIHVGSVKRVREISGVDLVGILDGNLIDKLALDVELLVGVFWGLCKPQADAAGIDAEDFGRRLNGEALDQGLVALFEGLLDFFPNPARELLRLTVAKTQSLCRVAEETTRKALAGKAMENDLRREIAGVRSSRPRASSASSRGRSRGGSSRK